jgi:hypothetical protein
MGDLYTGVSWGNGMVQLEQCGEGVVDPVPHDPSVSAR